MSPFVSDNAQLQMQLGIVRYKSWHNSVNTNWILKIETDLKFYLTIRIDSTSFIDQSPNPDFRQTIPAARFLRIMLQNRDLLSN